jgi:hypothetical protein
LRSLVLLHGPLNAHHQEVNALKCGDGVSSARSLGVK